MSRLWICVIILHVWQVFEDVPGSKCAKVVNMARMYMQGLHRFPNISEYPQYYWINCSQLAWSSLIYWLGFEYPSGKYARVLKMLQYSCNNITIVNILILFCSICIHRFTTTHFIFFKQELEHKNKESHK